MAALVLLATLLAQAAWILAVPPFRGMDEFDHAFRAAGVASGQWRLHDQAEGGRGLLVDVPEELVAASQGQCEGLAYIVPETCDGDGPGKEPGTVRATTSAANYEPVYYWVVGTAGEPFTGAHSLYAMRAMAALLCAIVLALAAWCLTTWVKGCGRSSACSSGSRRPSSTRPPSQRPTASRWRPGYSSGPRCWGSAAATGSAPRCCAVNAGCSPRRPCPSSCLRVCGRLARCGAC